MNTLSEALRKSKKRNKKKCESTKAEIEQYQRECKNVYARMKIIVKYLYFDFT